VQGKYGQENQDGSKSEHQTLASEQGAGGKSYRSGPICGQMPNEFSVESWIPAKEYGFAEHCIFKFKR
jgi:hypothetical protein